MNHAFNRRFICPWCQKGEALADGKAKVIISVICPKCRKAFTADLDTSRTERSAACRRGGRPK